MSTTTTSRPESTTETAPEAGWRLVAAREIAVKLRDKTFIWSTVFTLLVVVASIGLNAVLSGRSEDWKVAVVGQDAAAVVERAHEVADGNDDRITSEPVDSVEQAEEQVTAEEVDAALVPASEDGAGWQVVGDREIDGELRELLGDAARDRTVEQNAAAAGTTSAALFRGAELDERLLDPSAVPPGLQFAVGFAFAFLFLMATMSFGLAIAQSVVEEKQSRIVEILAATIPIRQLLAGKVLGNALLAIGQVVVMVAVGLIGLSLTGKAEGFLAIFRAGSWFMLFFLLGFGALACMWAVAGSVATRHEDLQSSTMPVQTVLFVSFFVGLMSEGTVLTVASYVPLVSTVAMPVRMLSEDIALWQPLLSAGLVVLTAVLLVMLGARLYEGSLLRTDRRTSMREALNELTGERT